MREGYHKHISSKHKFFDLKLREVWQYRELAWLITKRSFKVAYKQTILGPAWILIKPVLTSIVHVIVFGTIAKLTTLGIPQFLFHLTSTAIWSFFSGCVTSGSGTFLNNAHLFGKVYFPRLISPISSIITGILNFAIQMLMVIAMLIYYVPAGMVSPNFVAWLLIPLALVLLGIMGMGVGIIISSVTTKYRDLSILVGFGVQLWMYASPVVYPLDMFSEGWIRTVIQLNPATAPIEFLRYAILGVGNITTMSLVSTLVFLIFVTIFGIGLFNKVERTFIDTV